MLQTATSSRRDAPAARGVVVRPVIVTPNCSLRMGGEAALPYHFFRLLRARDVDARLVTHARNREELSAAWPREQDRISYAADNWLHKLLYRAGHPLPNRISRATFGMAAEFYTEAQQRRILRRLIGEGRANLVHKPIPVSPVQPSILHSLGAPVVFGPMNGGMDYPPGFRRQENRLERLTVRLGRRVGGIMNAVFPGKRRAAAILVANRRTRDALPAGVAACNVIELPENGVDLPLWQGRSARADSSVVRFVFLGRLVDWKAVDLLLESWSRARADGLAEAQLQVIGDGPMLASLKSLAQRLSIGDCVQFTGWLPQPEAAKRLASADVLVLPSLLECGGAVILEAMAAGLPAIAANWGGPADYLDDGCGILVAPTDREGFVSAFAAAMARLAGDSELRRRLGAAGRSKVSQLYDWDRKTDQILEIYEAALASNASAQGRLKGGIN